MADIDRRDLIKLAGLGVGAAAVGIAVPLGQSASTADWISTSLKPALFKRPMPVQQAMSPVRLTDEYGEYLFFELTERPGLAQILDPGAPKTPILGYAVGAGAPTVPGPLIKVDQNTRVRLRVHNALPTTHPTFGYGGVATSVHLHGSASLPQYDGFPDDLTTPGRYKDYWYPNSQGARTLWYHDHSVHRTAQNIYSGLFAQYHIQSPWEKANLPQGQYDVPLMISDAIFAKNGQLAYMDRDFSGMWGDVITVNGVPWPFHNVERRFYRFRVLMSTLSRSMTLSFVNTRTGGVLPTFVVATDGGVTPPQQVTSWRHASAERYEVMVDFGTCRIGDKVELRNASAKNNRNFLRTNKVMQLRVTRERTDTRWNVVPTPPDSEISTVMKASADAARRTRDIDMKHDDVTNEFSINDILWRDVQAAQWNIFADDKESERPRPGDYEIWRIENDSGGWFHPMHWHLADFRILKRSGGSGRVEAWEKGPKDTVYVGEGERVEILVHYAMPPTTYPDGRSTGQAGANGHLGGRYMIHCHNATHEDHDMMAQFLVAPASGEVDLSPSHPNHPVFGAPPV
jgi:FtsP/CotA-like multicopper oxidase with cupredoxin domain